MSAINMSKLVLIDECDSVFDYVNELYISEATNIMQRHKMIKLSSQFSEFTNVELVDLSSILCLPRRRITISVDEDN
jgi:hypothetical protein